MQECSPWSKQSGASLVSVMVATALFGIIAVMSSQSFKNLNTSSRKLESAMSAREIEGVIVQTVVARFKSYVLINKCAKAPTTYADFKTISIGSLGSAVIKPASFKDYKGNPITAPALAKEDLARCAATPFSKAPTLPDSKGFYQCFAIDIDPTAKAAASKSQEAFASNQGAFVEVFVKIRNLQTDAAIEPCSAMATGRGFGLEVYYALHWATYDPSGLLYDSKVGTLNVAL